MKHVLATLGAVVVAAAFAASAAADGAETQTVHFSATDVFVSDGRCAVPEGTLIVQQTEGQMTTVIGPGDTLHREAVFHGTISIAFGGQTYTGPFADHGVSADNQSNEVAVFVSTNLQRAEDGSLLNVHLLIHMSVNATGEPNLFVQLNCGGGDLVRA
jgi:hypothetical protein